MQQSWEDDDTVAGNCSGIDSEVGTQVLYYPAAACGCAIYHRYQPVPTRTPEPSRVWEPGGELCLPCCVARALVCTLPASLAIWPLAPHLFQVNHDCRHFVHKKVCSCTDYSVSLCILWNRALS